MQFNSTTLHDGDIRIDISGEMDALGCSEIQPFLKEIIDTEDKNNVLLDLSNVSFIDSSGIGAIVFLFKRLKLRNEALVIRGVHGQPRELIELLRIDSAIPVSFGQHSESCSDKSACN